MSSICLLYDLSQMLVPWNISIYPFINEVLLHTKIYSINLSTIDIAVIIIYFCYISQTTKFGDRKFVAFSLTLAFGLLSLQIMAL